MVQIRDIMTTDVLTLGPESTLREAAELFSAEHIGGAPVVAGGDVVGVISSTDVLGFGASSPGSPTARRPSPEWNEPREGDPGWPEEEENDALYFTEMWTDAGVDVLERFEETDRPEWDVMEEHDVSEAMTRSVHSLPPGTSVVEAARYLLEHDVHRVLVVEDDTLLGVVTSTDLVRAVAEHGLGG
jgi:CBS domain-containing protein